MGAREADEEKIDGMFAIEVAGELLVDRRRETPLCVLRPHPVQKGGEVWDAAAGPAAAAHHLQDQGAEVEHVRLQGRGGGRPGFLRRRRDLGVGEVAETGSPAFTARLEQDVGGLDGSMEGVADVQLVQPQCRVFDDVAALVPAHDVTAWLAVVGADRLDVGIEALVEAATAHEIVD